MNRLLSCCALSLALAAPAAQPANPNNPDDDAAAASGCLACGGCWLFAVVGGMVATVLIVVLHVLSLIWVAKDSRARGMDSSGMWVLVTVFTGFVGLLVYLASRPPGVLLECEHCAGKRLEYLRTCPHCDRR